jgi:hypothetical protein
MTIAESIQLNKEQIARALGVPAHMLADPHRTVAPRYWSLCMTSENHGTVGPAGCKFTHAPDKHERVLVVEVPAAADAPLDQVNLQLVGARRRRPVAEFKGYVDGQPAVTWLDRDNMPRVGTKLFIEPVAEQAAQVAPAEELTRFCPACGSVGDVGPAYRECCPDGNEARRIPKRLAEKCHELFKVALSTMRAAAPASPAQAAPLPASQPMIGKLLDQFSELPVLWGLNEPGALVRHGDVFKMLVAAGKAEQAQASTSGERQEGGAS